jgi:hypothetical protein
MIDHTLFKNIAVAISAYSHEAYTNAKKINGTAIVSTDGRISGDNESFIGQMRWYKPQAPVINNASLTNSAAGTYTDLSTEVADYIKAARTVGTQQVNLQSLISQQDGLAKMSRDYAEHRAQDEHNAILSVLKGVAAYEASRGTGIDTFDTNADGATTGFFVDINAAGAFGAAAVDAATERKLIDNTATGAARGERLFRALGMAYKDYEGDFMYMVTSPELLADLRAANLVDTTVTTEGSMTFQTIFGGKFRLLLTRAAQGNVSASANVNDRSTKTTFLLKPGCVSFTGIAVPTPVEVQRNAEAYAGGGSTSIWYRWSFIAHPLGYNWAGATNAFATDAAYGTAGSWTRKMDALNLGILPIFHS